MARSLKHSQKDYRTQVLADIAQGFILSGFCMLYIFMQTFAVPGTLSLSVLAGAVYGSLRGLALVTGSFLPIASRLHLVE